MLSAQQSSHSISISELYYTFMPTSMSNIISQHTYCIGVRCRSRTEQVRIKLFTTIIPFMRQRTISGNIYTRYALVLYETLVSVYTSLLCYTSHLILN